MTTKVVSRQMYVAVDGTEFNTQAECLMYERNEPEVKLKVLTNRLMQINDLYAGHKHKAAYIDRSHRTWYAGRMHAKALRDFRAGRDRKPDESGLEYLNRVGKLAGDVLVWKLAEADAVRNLEELRQARRDLLEEIGEVKSKILVKLAKANDETTKEKKEGAK